MPLEIRAVKLFLLMLNGPNDSLSAQMILIHLILCISMGDIILHLHIFRKREKKE